MAVQTRELKTPRGGGFAFAAAVVLTAAYVGVACICSRIGPVLALSVGVQIAGLPAVWLVCRRLPGASAALRVFGYFASLVVVFGANMVSGVHDWIWLPRCEIGAGVGASMSALACRALAGLVSLALLAMFASRSAACDPPKKRASTGTEPPVWSVVALAFAVFTWARLMSGLVRTHAERWCPAITGAGAAHGYRILLDAVSGFQEEIAFTGIALLLLLGRGWRAQAAAVVISSAARGLAHLYYADHASAGTWLLWAAVWSGGGLLLAFALGHQASKAGFGRLRFVAVYTAGTVVVHSFANFSLSGCLLALAIGALMLMIAVGLRQRGDREFDAFNWVVERESESKQVAESSAVASPGEAAIDRRADVEPRRAGR